MNSEFNWGPTWVVVTGASRGFGAALCECLAAKLPSGSLIFGLARSADGLKKTKELVSSANPNVKFTSAAVDLSSLSEEDARKALLSSLEGTDTSLLKTAVIIHNAGSLGDLDYLRDIQDMSKINNYYNFNISSVLSLNSIFLKLAREVITTPKLYVLHTSSLCAVQAIKSWGMYCVGKAARDMMFKVLAIEDPDITVLNYAPGPLDNDMQIEIQKNTKDPEVKQMFTDLALNKKLIPCKTSVNKLFQILTENKFKSGDHVDYYD